MGFGWQHEAKLNPKWDQKSMLTSKGRFYKNAYKTNRILMIFEVRGVEKSIKNQSKIDQKATSTWVMEGILGPLGDFLALLGAPGAQERKRGRGVREIWWPLGAILAPSWPSSAVLVLKIGSIWVKHRSKIRSECRCLSRPYLENMLVFLGNIGSKLETKLDLILEMPQNKKCLENK